MPASCMPTIQNRERSIAYARDRVRMHQRDAELHARWALIWAEEYRRGDAQAEYLYALDARNAADHHRWMRMFHDALLVVLKGES